MTLEDWRLISELSYAALGDYLGIPGETARRYCRGRRIPGRTIMLRIVERTRGSVTANDFYGIAA